MAEEPLRRVERVVTTYDVTWILDLDKNGQLDLNPSYQRKSVWTPKDRRFFMDTVFRNYPSPAIFLHKSIDDETGRTTYHVVDGKQRISTILMFVKDSFALSDDFGDRRFNGKRWRDFDDPTIKRLLWNYRITVEELDDASVLSVNDVFSRLNKNASKLTSQELRHARFDGWLINFLENQAQDPIWKTFKVHTAAKERRMLDVQHLSELAAVTIRGDISGFNQDDLDQFYADFDNPDAEESEFDTEIFTAAFLKARGMLESLEEEAGIVSKWAQPFLHLYVLWAALARKGIDANDIHGLCERYAAFMKSVQEYEVDDSGTPQTIEQMNSFNRHVATYKAASVGATTEEPKRRDRLSALESAVFTSE